MAKSRTKAVKDSNDVEVKTCRSVFLPDNMLLRSSKIAIQHDPRNDPRPALERAFASSQVPNEVLKPEFIAAVTTRYWGVAGVNLSVRFLDNPNQATRTKLLQHMNAWGQFGNIRFAETLNSSGDVRITRTRGSGYWSYIGTDIRSISVNEPTMNLEAFTEQTPESEYNRVVKHETGHTLSFPHEHQRADIVALLDPQKTIRYMQNTYGWDAQTTTEQVLTPLDERSLMGTPVDVQSIMAYQLPGSCTKNGQPIIGGTDIDPSDSNFAAKIYPLSINGGNGGNGNGGSSGSVIPGANEQGNLLVNLRNVAIMLNAVGYNLVKK